jgi:hypothetical protein
VAAAVAGFSRSLSRCLFLSVGLGRYLSAANNRPPSGVFAFSFILTQPFRLKPAVCFVLLRLLQLGPTSQYMRYHPL